MAKTIQFVVKKRLINLRGKKETIFVPVQVEKPRVSMEEVANQVEKRTSLGKGDVLNAISTMGEVIAEHIKLGRTVEIDNFGTFRPRFKMKSEDTEEKVTDNNVQFLGIGFRPTVNFNNTTRGARFVLVSRDTLEKGTDPNAGGTDPNAGGGSTPLDPNAGGSF